MSTLTLIDVLSYRLVNIEKIVLIEEKFISYQDVQTASDSSQVSCEDHALCIALVD